MKCLRTNEKNVIQARQKKRTMMVRGPMCSTWNLDYFTGVVIGWSDIFRLKNRLVWPGFSDAEYVARVQRLQSLAASWQLLEVVHVTKHYVQLRCPRTGTTFSSFPPSSVLRATVCAQAMWCRVSGCHVATNFIIIQEFHGNREAKAIKVIFAGLSSCTLSGLLHAYHFGSLAHFAATTATPFGDEEFQKKRDRSPVESQKCLHLRIFIIFSQTHIGQLPQAEDLEDSPYANPHREDIFHHSATTTVFVHHHDGVLLGGQ